MCVHTLIYAYVLLCFYSSAMTTCHRKAIEKPYSARYFDWTPYMHRFTRTGARRHGWIECFSCAVRLVAVKYSILPIGIIRNVIRFLCQCMKNLMTNLYTCNIFYSFKCQNHLNRILLIQKWQLSQSRNNFAHRHENVQVHTSNRSRTTLFRRSPASVRIIAAGHCL